MRKIRWIMISLHALVGGVLGALGGFAVGVAAQRDDRAYVAWGAAAVSLLALLLELGEQLEGHGR